MDHFTCEQYGQVEDEFQFNFNYACRSGETLCRDCIAQKIPFIDLVTQLGEYQDEAETNWRRLHGPKEPDLEWNKDLLLSPQYWQGKKHAFIRAIELVVSTAPPVDKTVIAYDRLERLDSILLNKDPECEPCEEIAVGRAQAYHEVREFLRTGKWREARIIALPQSNHAS